MEASILLRSSTPIVKKRELRGSLQFLTIPNKMVLQKGKLEPSGKKGIFVGYSDSAKAYRIYVPSQNQIELSRDVIFEEDLASQNLRIIHEYNGWSQSIDKIQPSEIQRERNEITEEALEPIDIPCIPSSSTINKKKPLWATKMLEDANNYAAPLGTFRERKRPKRYTNYIAYMSDIIDSKPSYSEEALSHQAWKDVMIEEYRSIIKNDVWDIVPRPKDKSVVSSKWIFKIKHVADGSIEKHKARFVARGFSQKEGIDCEETFAPIARYTSVNSIITIAASKGWKIHQMDVKLLF